MEDRSCVVAEPQPQAKSKEGKPHHLSHEEIKPGQKCNEQHSWLLSHLVTEI